jgi:hypothetical protein
MTISQWMNDQVIGPHEYSPEGPFGTSGNFPLPSTKPGQVLIGDNEGAFVFLQYAVPAAITLNQGDFMCWDESFNAVPTSEIQVAGEYPMGTAVGTMFFGGQVPQLQASPVPGSIPGNIWSYTFQPGVYGIWCQRYGISLVNVALLSAASPSATGTLVFPQTTATKNRITFLTTSAATTLNGMPAGTVNTAAFSRTFTGNTVTGSAVITGVNITKFMAKGMAITGSGIPAVSSTQPQTIILDIQGSTVTISNPATATASGVTFTAAKGLTTGNSVTGSNIVTGVPGIAGLYPNQAVTLAGFATPTILGISGKSPSFTLQLSVNSTAGAANGQLTLNTTNNYVEGFLREPMYNTAL